MINNNNRNSKINQNYLNYNSLKFLHLYNNNNN